MLGVYLIYFVFFAIGTAFGSFLNLVSDRIVAGLPIIFGRSKCDFCRKPLTPKNLVPLFSFLFQRGRSLCCKKPLSWTYPVSELMTGAAFLFAVHNSRVITNFSFINVIALVYLLAIFSFFIILFFTDVKYKLLPDKIVFTAIFVALFFILLLGVLDLKFYHDKLLSSSFGPYLIKAGFWQTQLFAVFKRILTLLVSACFISLFFVMLIWITKGRGMGGGDVKLGFLIGLFNGFPGNILAVFLGFLLGSLYSMVLISMGRKKVKDTIAFGPFLILGSFIAFVWGEKIIRWYFGLV